MERQHEAFKWTQTTISNYTDGDEMIQVLDALSQDPQGIQDYNGVVAAVDYLTTMFSSEKERDRVNYAFFRAVYTPPRGLPRPRQGNEAHCWHAPRFAGSCGVSGSPGKGASWEAWRVDGAYDAGVQGLLCVSFFFF